MSAVRALSIAVVALLLAACARQASDSTVLVYATPYGPSHPFSRADREWMDFVEQQSAGRLRIRPNWQGALLSSEHSLIELRHGVADIGLITPIYVKGGAHLIRMQSGFYSGASTIEQQVALYRCLEAAHPQVRERTRRPERAGRAGRQPARHRDAEPAGADAGRPAGASNPRADGAARRAARSGRRSGQHADGRGLFRARQRRHRRRDRADGHPARCISPRSPAGTPRCRCRAAPIPRAPCRCADGNGCRSRIGRVLEASVPVWEAALARQTRREAQDDGYAAAKARWRERACDRRTAAASLRRAVRGGCPSRCGGPPRASASTALAVFETARRCETGNAMSQPLSGIRIADFSHVMAGPYARRTCCGCWVPR